LKKKYISQINIFFKGTFRIFQKSLVKSVSLPIITTKNSIIFGHIWIGEIENKMPKMLKKKIVNDGILLKFCISNISSF